MKIADCLPLMTQMYLSRTVDSILKDEVPRGNEERLREQVRQNAKELADPDRVIEALREETQARAQRILMEAMLKQLLALPHMTCAEESLFDKVRDFEQEVITSANEPDAFAFSDRHSIDVYSEVLDVALADDDISVDEHRLLTRLRRKLGVSRREHQLLAAKLGKFPKPGGSLHTVAEFRDTLKRLQSTGILLYCNRADGGPRVALPEELAKPVKKFLGFEMSLAAQELLHDELTNDQLYRVLQDQALPVSGSKGERSRRLLKAGVKPSEVLTALQNEELREICRKLPGVNVSGSKPERIDRIIGYFDSLTTKEPEPSDDPRALYYQYFEEFACRDNKNLYQRKLIRHDRDMEAGFEEGTRYLFEEKFALDLVEMPGSEHADGGVAFPNGELLLWDNKGKENIYSFPKSHLDQFKRYIRESPKRVNVFLVIVPDCNPAARLQAMKLKHESATDTDVALITAEDLKWLAENWRDRAKRSLFSLEVFNFTGILDRPALEERVAVLLS